MQGLKTLVFQFALGIINSQILLALGKSEFAFGRWFAWSLVAHLAREDEILLAQKDNPLVLDNEITFLNTVMYVPDSNYYQ